MISIVASLF